MLVKVLPVTLFTLVTPLTVVLAVSMHRTVPCVMLVIKAGVRDCGVELPVVDAAMVVRLLSCRPSTAPHPGFTEDAAIGYLLTLGEVKAVFLIHAETQRFRVVPIVFADLECGVNGRAAHRSLVAVQLRANDLGQLLGLAVAFGHRRQREYRLVVATHFLHGDGRNLRGRAVNNRFQGGILREYSWVEARADHGANRSVRLYPCNQVLLNHVALRKDSLAMRSIPARRRVLTSSRAFIFMASNAGRMNGWAFTFVVVATASLARLLRRVIAMADRSPVILRRCLVARGAMCILPAGTQPFSM